MDEIEFSVASARRGPDTWGLRITGELDLYTAPDVRDELAALPVAVREVEVDLTALSFVDSAGIAVLLVAAQRLRARDGAMTLVVDDHRVLRALEVTGLDRFFEIRRSRLAAVE